jgi:hypothetical protein
MKRVVALLKDSVEKLDTLIRADKEYIDHLVSVGRHTEAERVIFRREERTSLQEEVKDAIEVLEGG